MIFTDAKVYDRAEQNENTQQEGLYNFNKLFQYTFTFRIDLQKNDLQKYIFIGCLTIKITIIIIIIIIISSSSSILKF